MNELTEVGCPAAGEYVFIIYSFTIYELSGAFRSPPQTVSFFFLSSSRAEKWLDPPVGTPQLQTMKMHYREKK